MKQKPLLWVVIIGAITSLLFAIYTIFANPSYQENPSTNSQVNETSSVPSSPSSDSASYVEYSKENLDAHMNKRRVLFFYASWCPTCRPADASIKANRTKLPTDVSVIRVNYNDTDTDLEEKEFAKKYGVTYQHTFVQIDSSGNSVTKWNGGSIDELLSRIK